MDTNIIYINIILNNNNYGLSNDAKILVKYLDQIKGDNYILKVRPVSIYSYQTGYVDINIFLETYNPILFHYAKVNILIPNQEWFLEEWIPYVNDIDYIWCKTKYMYDIFKEKQIDENKLNYIGWTSIDKYKGNITKESFCIHLSGKSLYKGTQRMIDSWNESLPKLKIIYQNNNIIKNDLSNIEYINTRLTDEELSHLMNKALYHICLSETEGFGHYINEALSTSSIVLTTNRLPMKLFVEEEYLVNIVNNEKINGMLDNRCIFDKKDLIHKIQYINQLDKHSLHNSCKLNRQTYLKSIKTLRLNLKSEFIKITKMLKDKTYYPKIPIEISTKSEQLPNISIVTLTYNRPEFFNLMILNYFGIDYPRDKIEWIIVDDSDLDNSIKPLIDKLNDEQRKTINFIYLKDKTSIGEKRNIGVMNSKYSYIAFMDDDDLYFPRNILLRLSYLDYYQKDCCYCSTIGCFHINKLISHINVPPLNKPFYKRVSEASLLFKKSFWLEKPFLKLEQEEGGEFLKSRYNKCIEISYKDIFISLLHSKNISSKISIGNEPNGCHFGLSDELFKIITNIQQ